MPMRSALPLRVLSTNTPMGAPSTPPAITGRSSRTRRWRRVWAMISANTASDTVLTTTTTACGSITRSNSGLVAIPIPKPTVLSTVAPMSITGTATRISVTSGIRPSA